MKMNKALYGAVYVCVIDPVPIARLYELPSPKKQTATWPLRRILAESAAPVAMPVEPPTIALAPR